MSAINRRSVLTGALALGGAALTGRSVVAQAGTDVLARAHDFVTMLSDRERRAALFPFGGRTHRRWNDFGSRVKPGLRMEQMDRDQRIAAIDLLSTLLSPTGMEKFDRVRALQEVVRERGAGPADRSAERFSFALFGMPSAGSVWGLRVEGHHLSLSFTMQGEAVVGVTPSSFSSNPNEVHGGRFDGLVALREEHALAARLMGDLAPPNARVARISGRAHRNILTTAGREDRLFGARREGVPLADLTTSQRDVALRIVDAFTSDHLAGPLAEEQAGRVRSGDTGGIHFAWAGGTVGELMSYRLHGDTFLIELATNPPEPFHLHTIFHDLERHLGRHVT